MLLWSRELGGRDQSPLVILHGLLGSSRNWLSAGRDLTAHFQVHLLDLRNHGQSPWSPEMNYTVMVDDVLSWMNAQGLGRVHLVGHSLGGKLAMRLACRYPERLESLTVVDIAPRRYVWPNRPGELAALEALDLSALGSRSEAEARLETAIPDLAHRRFFLGNLESVEGGGWRWQPNLAVIRRALAELEDTPLEETDRFSGPTRFIVGERSEYFGTADEALVRKHFPEVRFVRLPGVGHNPHVEDRPALVAALADQG